MSPAEEGAAPNDTLTPRVWLRIDPDLQIDVGTEIQDPVGRWWLLADHEHSVVADQPIYRSFRAFRLTHNVSWIRMATVTDTLTGLSRSSGETELGPLRCVMDPDRVYRDGVLRVMPNAALLITGQAVLLNDRIDGRIIKRLNKVLGVHLAELE